MEKLKKYETGAEAASQDTRKSEKAVSKIKRLENDLDT